MDISTILGFLIGWGLVLFSIASGVGLGPFIDVPSLLIVLGGTVGASMINYPLAQITGAGKGRKPLSRWWISPIARVGKAFSHWKRR